MSSELCAVARPRPGARSAVAAKDLIKAEVRHEAAARREQLTGLGASHEIVRGLVQLFEVDGAFGIAALGARKSVDELALTRAYIRLGEALGLDWAQQQVARFVPADPWERLLVAGLARDFEQMRIEFLGARPQRGSRSVGRALGRAQCRADGAVPPADRPRADRTGGQLGDAGADRQPGANPACPLSACGSPSWFLRHDYPEVVGLGVRGRGRRAHCCWAGG